jgi:hypothetical protein
VLDSAVDGPDQYDTGADVHGQQWALDIAYLDSSLDASSMKDTSDDGKEGNDTNLDNEREFHQHKANVLPCPVNCRVHKPCDAECIGELNNQGEKAKSGQSATWMKRSAVWDVVKNATEDVLVCQLEDWPKQH